MSIPLAEIAKLVDGQLVGNGDLVITGAAILRDAQPGQITLADKAELAGQLAESPAVAVIVPPDFDTQGTPAVVVDNVADAFAKVVCHFRPTRIAPQRGISPAAHISSTARLADDVEVHPGVTIADDVQIASGVTVHAGVHIMAGCKIGADVTIFPAVVLYENTLVGPRCILHSGAVLGAYGFGYDSSTGRHVLSHQLGYVELEADVEVGAGATIDCGTYGPTLIGEGTKIDDQVQIAHNCRIGKHNLICSQAGIAGSSTTGDYVVVAGQVGVADHVHIGAGAVLGAQTGVVSDVPAGETFLGSPSMSIREFWKQQAVLGKLPQMRKQLRALERRVEQIQAAMEAAQREAA